MTDRRTVIKRGHFLLVILAIVGISFTLRAAQLQIFQHGKYRKYADSQHKSSIPLKAKRGSIFDRNGNIIAADVETKSYSICPKHISDKGAAAAKLAKLTGKSKRHWLNKFKNNSGFLYVERMVSPKKEKRYEKAGIETLRSRVETKRIYPYKRVADEIIGETDPDAKGISGLENYYDNYLAGTDGNSIYLRDARGKEITAWEKTLVEPVNGSDIYLSLDIDLQQIVEKELQRQLDSSGAINGSAIFLDVRTGGVLACATVEASKRAKVKCRPIEDQNEPGSTAKIAPIATVYLEDIFEPDDKMYVENGKFRVGAYNIYDDHKYDTLTCNEVGIFSSNIGVTKMGLEAGAERIYKTLIQLGVGTKTGIDFPYEAAGSITPLEKWNDHTLGTICFGYGISLSSLQIATAYGAIASGGELLKPFFAERIIDSEGDEKYLNRKTVVRYLFDDETIGLIQEILADVVKIGTAKKAQNDVVSIVGKTGTAKRIKKEGRGYDRKRCLASFAGYFPADNPQVVGVVMFDEPESSIYGGEVAAPALRDIAVRYACLPRNKMMVDNRFENDDDIIDDTRFANETDDIIKIKQTVIKHPIGLGSDITNVEFAGVLPDLRGLTVREAIRAAKDNDTKYKIQGSGRIISQAPKPGTKMEKVICLTLVGDCK